jgi:hypothetical protein
MATSLKTQDLGKPLLDSGSRSVNFFNGRLLTANDLRREQEARNTADRWLGQAVGDGVAFGLEVRKHAHSSAEVPIVSVEAGLAVNRDGQALHLKAQTAVSLVRQAKDTGVAMEGATFAQCGGLTGGLYRAGPGLYLFTIAPARAAEGKAPTTGFDPFGGKCNTDAIVDTVQFRLISLESQLADVDLANEDKLRNAIAYRCFGAGDLTWFPADPLGTDFSKYGLLDELAANVLTPCDVPLALLYWTLTGGLRFVDMWAVRRRITPRPSTEFSWLTDERRSSEGRAMFLQFEDHVRAVLTAAGGPVRAVDRFTHLPSAGILPAPGDERAAKAAAQRFFETLTTRGPFFIEGARLEPLLRMSFAYPPIDLKSGEVIWLYWVRENRQSIAQRLTPASRGCLVFASGHMPYAADARFNLSKWDYANVALDATGKPGG